MEIRGIVFEGMDGTEEAVVGSVVTKERLHEAVQTLEKYHTGKKNFEARCIENEQWWKLRHWEQIKEKGTTSLKTKSAWLVNVVLSKHADAMDAYPEPSFLPREQGDEAEAKMLSSVVPVVLQNAGFEDAWNKNWWKKLKAGVGIYGVFWDKNKLNGLGDIAIRKIDPLQLFWEPGITDIQDSRNVFHVELCDNETLEEQYPQIKGKLSASSVKIAEYVYDDSVDTSNKSAVIDWYYKKRVDGRTVLHYVKFVGETVLYATEDDRGTDPPSQDRQFVNRPYEETGDTSSVTGKPVTPSHEGEGFGGRAMLAPTGGTEEAGMAERGLYDHGMYPFFMDELFPDEGTPTGFGYIDICKDPQRQIDLMNTAIVGNSVAAATPRWLKSGDSGINEEEFNDWTKPVVHVEGGLDDSRMRQIQVQPLSGNYLAILQNKIDEMKETSGNRDVNNGGAPSGVTAASAIAAMQEQSGKLSRDQINGSYRVFRKVVYCVIELIRQFYDAPRVFRITGENDRVEYVTFDNSGLQPQLQGGTEFGVDMGMRQPEFDIEVTSAKQSSYSKLSYNELAIQFFQLGFFNPQMADQALAAMDMMDFKGKEKVRQKIQENGGMYQQLLIMQAQMQQMAAMLGLNSPSIAAIGSPLGGEAKSPSATASGSRNAPEALGGDRQQNRIVEKARDRANQATQPG